MLRAVFARTLKPGVTYEQFKDAWVPEGMEGAYPARARVARNLADDRQVITIIELDVPADELKASSASLVRGRTRSSGSSRSSTRPSWRVSTRTSSRRRRCRTGRSPCDDRPEP